MVIFLILMSTFWSLGWRSSTMSCLSVNKVYSTVRLDALKNKFFLNDYKHVSHYQSPIKFSFLTNKSIKLNSWFIFARYLLHILLLTETTICASFRVLDQITSPFASSRRLFLNAMFSISAWFLNFQLILIRHVPGFNWSGWVAVCSDVGTMC